MGFLEGDENIVNVKKLIAREGLIILIFLAIIVTSLSINDKFVSSMAWKPLTEEQYNKAISAGYTPDQIIEFEKRRKSERVADIKDSIDVFVFLLYPFYLLIRFIVWAIRTLK